VKKKLTTIHICVLLQVDGHIITSELIMKPFGMLNSNWSIFL